MKSTDEIFRKTASFYDAILENSREVILLSDNNFKILFSSSSSERVTGWGSEELIGKKFSDLIIQEDVLLFNDAMKKVLEKSGKSIALSFRALHKYGTTIYLEGSIINKLDVDSIKGIVFNLHQIDVHYEAEITKINREISDYKYALDESSIVAITNSKGIIFHANDNFCKISKFKREELIGQDHRIINSGYHPKEFIRELWTTIANGKIWKGDLKNKAKDGTIYWVDTTIIPFLNEQGKPYQYVAIRSDITNRKKLEEDIFHLNEILEIKVEERTRELQESKMQLTEMLDNVSFLASIAENIQDPIISADNNLLITRWNHAAENLFGWKSEEVIGKSTTEILRTQFTVESKEEILKAIVLNEHWQGELIYFTKNGDKLNVLSTASILKDKAGKKIGMLVLVRDITARKFAEKAVLKMNVQLEKRVTERTEEIQKREKRFRALIENNNDVISLMDEKFNVVYRSPSAARITGWSDLEIKQFSAISKIHPDDLEEVNAIVKELYANPGKHIKCLFRNLHKSGHYIWLEGVAINLLHDENIKAIVYNFRDITEKVKAEEELAAGEIRFRALIENSGEGIALVDKNSNVLYRSPAAKILIGDISKENTLLHVHPDEQKLIVQKFALSLENPGTPIEFQGRVLHATGYYFWIEGTLTNLLEVKGVNAIVANYRDITARKRSEEEKELFSSIVNYSDDAIISKDLDGIITSWNRGAEIVFGFKSEEVVGKHISVLIPTHLQYEEVDIINKIKKGEYVDHYETERIRKDGKIINVTLTVSPLKDAHGKIVGASKISRDVTEKKKVEKELSKNIIELERSNKELEQFAYIASHDLQEPLRMVGSYMQLIERRYKGRLDADADEFIHYAVDGANRMKLLINDLLNYSRMNNPGTILPVDLNKLLEEILINLTESIAESSTQIHCGPLPTIQADRTQMIQLFQNLISNAIKFRREGVTPEIFLSAVKKSNEWLFSIADNGIGIDKLYTEKVFIVFKQLHTKAKYGGTGIGLAIAKKIVERHGGKIWFDSIPGQGTTFYFTLKQSI